MTNYHVNPETGVPGICSAEHNCKFGKTSDHFTTAAEAMKSFENKMNTKTLPVVEKKSFKQTRDEELKEIKQEYAEMEHFLDTSGYGLSTVKASRKLVKMHEKAESLAVAAIPANIQHKVATWGSENGIGPKAVADTYGSVAKHFTPSEWLILKSKWSQKNQDNFKKYMKPITLPAIWNSWETDAEAVAKSVAKWQSKTTPSSGGGHGYSGGHGRGGAAATGGHGRR